MNDNASPEAQKAWITLMRQSRHLLDMLGQELKAADLPPIEWYDILWELEKGPTEGLRPQTLEDRTLLKQYQMSRLLKRMETAGFLSIRQLDSDKRGQMVSLTASGSSVREKIWQTYSAFLAAKFDQQYTKEDLETLTTLLSKLQR